MLRYKCGLMLASLMFVSQAAGAQETDIGGKVSVELNAAETENGSCKLTFLITNGLDEALDKVIYEAVLFDSAGQVDRLTLFDFGNLPPARPRVRQFAVPQVDCEGLGSVLFNGANSCVVEGNEINTCEAELMTKSRTTIEVSG